MLHCQVSLNTNRTSVKDTTLSSEGEAKLANGRMYNRVCVKCSQLTCYSDFQFLLEKHWCLDCKMEKDFLIIKKHFCCRTFPLLPLPRCCSTYFKTKCRLAERRGSVNCVVLLLWSTKYTRPVAVFRISQPGGRGPSSSQLTLLRSLK